MKTIALLASLLILLSCAAAPIPPISIEKPAPIPVQIASGFDDQISWRCEQQEINPALVWVSCEFKNTSKDILRAASTCINVSYYEEANTTLVAYKSVCSGVLVPGDAAMGYVAFTQKERRKLDTCGEMMNGCVLLAGTR
jgi:hypothetical protein